MDDSSNSILDGFLQGKFERMNCPQCENTFLTNVYAMPGDDYVLLEKYALGLEYFCDAIQQYDLTQVPFIRRIGVLGAEDDSVQPPEVIQLFTYNEPDYRVIYVMERLEHLGEADAAFFSDHVFGMDWKEEHTRHEILAWIRERYGETLAEDIRKLCLYFRQHEDYLAWDLHGNNLMRRTRDGEIVVMDPFAPKMGEYL